MHHLLRRAQLGQASLPGLLTSTLMLALCASAGGQTADGPNPQPSAAESLASLPDAPLPQAGESSGDNDAVTLRKTPVHILKDQAAIWTSPARIRAQDLKWLVPLTLATGAAIATDHRALSSVVSHDATFNHANVDASNELTAGLIVTPVALYGAGRMHADAHAQEAGILSGEAILDGLVVEQGMKLVFWRERPGADSGRGRFFQTGAGVDSSFPSSHSMLAWSSAAVIAGEYPSKWVQFGVYSAAAGVSITRVLGQEHFPSDALVGSAVGWLIGHYVYRRHHKARTR
jgi:membrane-associated phospholipid phosphatase